MKKLFLVLVLMVSIFGNSMADDTPRIIVPGKAGIDVEQLNKNIEAEIRKLTG